jgi:hypothetical protein
MINDVGELHGLKTRKRENAKTRKSIFASQNFIVNFKKREFQTRKNKFIVNFLNNFTVKFETRKINLNILNKTKKKKNRAVLLPIYSII